jgi:hypothetical protein
MIRDASNGAVYSWRSITGVRYLCARLLRDCKILNKPEDTDRLESWAEELERRSKLPPRLSREPSHDQHNVPVSLMSCERVEVDHCKL